MKTTIKVTGMWEGFATIEGGQVERREGIISLRGATQPKSFRYHFQVCKIGIHQWIDQCPFSTKERI